MKVVYVKSVIEKILEARDAAQRAGKKIEYIELNAAEWDELARQFFVETLSYKGVKLLGMSYYILDVEVRKDA